MADGEKLDVDGFVRGLLAKECAEVGNMVMDRCVRRDPVPGAKIAFALLMADRNGPGMSWAASMSRGELVAFLRQAADKLERTLRDESPLVIS